MTGLGIYWDSMEGLPTKRDSASIQLLSSEADQDHEEMFYPKSEINLAVFVSKKNQDQDSRRRLPFLALKLIKKDRFRRAGD